jgi:arsenate reductase (thioredoxin)
MAQGYLQHFAGNKAEVYSAGIEAHGVNPKAIQVMKEDGVEISHHTSNTIDKYLGIDFDYIITVCDNAKENCPYFPSKAQKFHHDFPDPAKATGTPEVVLNEFRKVRDMIKDYSREFIKNL